jgi:hypothetical protein
MDSSKSAKSYKSGIYSQKNELFGATRRILNIDENSLPEQIDRKYRKNPPHA